MKSNYIPFKVLVYDTANVNYYYTRGIFLYPFHCIKGYANYSTTYRDYNFDDNYGGNF